MTLIFALALALASSNFCEYGPKNDPNFDRPKLTQILALALALALDLALAGQN